VLEIKCLRTITDVRWFDRVRNTRVRDMCGNQLRLLERANQGVVNWFGRIERMEEERVIKGIYRSTVEGDRLMRRPRKGWRVGVKETLSHRGLSIQEGERRVWDRVSWCIGGRHGAEIWNLKQCEGAGVNRWHWGLAVEES